MGPCSGCRARRGRVPLSVHWCSWPWLAPCTAHHPSRPCCGPQKPAGAPGSRRRCCVEPAGAQDSIQHCRPIPSPSQAFPLDTDHSRIACYFTLALAVTVTVTVTDTSRGYSHRNRYGHFIVMVTVIVTVIVTVTVTVWLQLPVRLRLQLQLRL